MVGPNAEDKRICLFSVSANLSFVLVHERRRKAPAGQEGADVLVYSPRIGRSQTSLKTRTWRQPVVKK